MAFISIANVVMSGSKSMLSLEYAQPVAALRDMVSVFYLAKISSESGVVNERAAIGQLRILSGAPVMARIGDMQIRIPPGTYIFGPTIKGLSYWCEAGASTILGAGLLPAGWDVVLRKDASLLLNQIAAVAGTDTHEPILGPLAIGGDPLSLLAATKARAIDAGADALASYFTGLLPHLETTIVKFTYVVDAWLMANWSPDIDDLVANTGLSARQLERLCKQCFGMPPKMLARKYRALRAARALSDPNGESQDAMISAFYDQSHMIREVKYFAGETPGKIRMHRAEVDLLIDQRRAMAGSISRLVTET